MSEIDLVVPPHLGFSEENLSEHLKKIGKLGEEQHFAITKRSIDARQQNVKINLRVAIDQKPLGVEYVEYFKQTQNVENAPEIIIIGAGPAGIFAGIKAIENGLKPIILDRGKDVRARRRDLAAINKDHIVNPDSNYCFGEGGAGTYSDGKLYTRSKKRGSVRRVFEILVAHGAPEDILFESHPHIGTNKLPNIVTALRETIESAGGQVIFDAKVVDFLLESDQITGVKLANGDTIKGEATILATGHSARDIFRLCEQHKINIEAKPFALGVRVEHPQQLIDSIQYHCDDRGDYLPPSAYSLVAQTQFQKQNVAYFLFVCAPEDLSFPPQLRPEN